MVRPAYCKRHVRVDKSGIAATYAKLKLRYPINFLSPTGVPTVAYAGLRLA